MGKNKPLDRTLSQFDRLDGQKTARFVHISPHEIHIHTDRIRRDFDESELHTLADSICAIGILQPLLVCLRPGGHYILIAGERRLRAAKLAGLESVPAYVFQGMSEEVLIASLSENLSRADLNPYERAEGILRLLEELLSMTRSSLLARIRSMSNALRKGKEGHPSLTDKVGQDILGVFQSMGYSLRSFAEKDVPIFRLPANVLRALKEGAVPYRTAALIARAPTSLHPRLVKMARDGATYSDVHAFLAKTKKGLLDAAPLQTERLQTIARALVEVENPSPEVDRAIDRLERLLGLMK